MAGKMGKALEDAQELCDLHRNFTRFRCEAVASTCTLYNWSCAEGYDRSSYACSECSADFYRSGRQCLPCPSTDVQKAFTIILIAILAIALLYSAVRYLALNRYRDHASAAFALLVTHAQLMSAVVRMPYPWPAELAGVMSVGGATHALTFHPGTLACLSFFKGVGGYRAHAWFALLAWVVAAAFAALVHAAGARVCRPKFGCAARAGFRPRSAWPEQGAGTLLQLWGLVLIPTTQSVVEPFAVGWDPQVPKELRQTPRFERMFAYPDANRTEILALRVQALALGVPYLLAFGGALWWARGQETAVLYEVTLTRTRTLALTLTRRSPSSTGSHGRPSSTTPSTRSCPSSRCPPSSSTTRSPASTG